MLIGICACGHVCGVRGWTLDGNKRLFVRLLARSLLGPKECPFDCGHRAAMSALELRQHLVDKHFTNDPHQMKKHVRTCTCVLLGWRV